MYIEVGRWVSAARDVYVCCCAGKIYKKYLDSGAVEWFFGPPRTPTGQQHSFGMNDGDVVVEAAPEEDRE